MKTMRTLTLLMLAGMLAVIAGCGKPDTPAEVTQAFWKAMQQGNMSKALALTNDPKQEIKPLNESSRKVPIKFAEPVVTDTTATVETTFVKKNKDGSDKNIVFNTYLVQTDAGWRVHWPKTWAHLTRGSALDSLLNSLEQLGQTFTQGLNQTLNGVAASMPQLSEQLQQLGEATTRQIQENWREYLPEVQKSIDELAANLGQTMQQGNEKLQKDLQQGVEELQKNLPEIQKQMNQASKDTSKDLANQWREAMKQLNEGLQEMQKNLEEEKQQGQQTQ